MNTHILDDAAESLARLLAEENACLERIDYPGAIAMAQAKRRAVETLVAAQQANEAAAGGPRVSAELARRLERVADDNRRLLARALVVQSQVIDCFVRAIPAAHASPRYGARGTVTRMRSAAPVALLSRA